MSDKKDNIFSIVTLAGEFTDKSVLQEETNRLFVQNKRYAETIQNLNAEIAHLKMLLNSTVPIVSSGAIEIIQKSDAEVVCDIQIALIRERTADTEISFEDAKKLEILVKTKKLHEEKSGKTLKGEKSKPDVSDELLVSLASQPVKE